MSIAMFSLGRAVIRLRVLGKAVADADCTLIHEEPGTSSSGFPDCSPMTILLLVLSDHVLANIPVLCEHTPEVDHSSRSLTAA